MTAPKSTLDRIQNQVRRRNLINQGDVIREGHLWRFGGCDSNVISFHVLLLWGSTTNLVMVSSRVDRAPVSPIGSAHTDFVPRERQ
jgi:hypothetical protein